MSDGSSAASATSSRAEENGEVKPFSPAVAISNKMVRLLAAYMGRGPTRARTTIAPNLVVVVFGDTMTRAERNLTEAGEPGSVVSMRRTLHAQMRGEAVAAVEDILECEVAAYMSDIDTDADVAVIAFALQPAEQARASPVS